MIELSRDIAFGQYINNGSALSRMDPRTKLFCTLLLIVVVSYVSSFASFAVFLIFCTILQWTSHISTSYVLRSFRTFTAFLIFAFVIEVLFYPNTPAQHKTLIWQWGIFAVSWEGIIRSVQTIIRVLFLFYIISMLTYTTSLVDLTDGSEALLSPLQKVGIPVSALVMVMVIAFKFVPIFVTEIERLMKAHAARGVRFDQGNVIQRALKVAALLVPLFVSGFKRAEVLTVAMEARCYGGRPGWKRSKRRALHFERFDALVLTITIIVCIAAVIVNIVAPV